MNRPRAFWLSIQATLWFLPTLLVVGAVGLAVALVDLQTFVQSDLAKLFPRLLGASAEGARAMLSAIATSMITVAGVVFSITIVALTLASTQYSPRVLRNFMSDRPTQIVLGTFVAIYAYCLVVLRTIRGSDDLAFVPSLAVLGGVAMAFVGVAVLIYFVHHVATSIQVSEILLRIRQETETVVGRLFPQALGHPAPEDWVGDDGPTVPEHWLPVPSPRSGYLVAVDSEGLLALARSRDDVVQMAVAIGDFVVAGRPLLLVARRSNGEIESCDDLLRCFSIERQRTIHQDAPFGLQQIVDVALKALSPSMHDPTTARACIDHLSALMVNISGREIPSRYRCTDGRLRVIARGPDYESMMATAFDSIIHHAATHVDVFEGLLTAFDRIARVVDDDGRRTIVTRLLDTLMQRAEAADLPARRKRTLIDHGRGLRDEIARHGPMDLITEAEAAP